MLNLNCRYLFLNTSVSKKTHNLLHNIISSLKLIIKKGPLTRIPLDTSSKEKTNLFFPIPSPQDTNPEFVRIELT